jgi:hypothetical protein
MNSFVYDVLPIGLGHIPIPLALCDDPSSVLWTEAYKIGRL